MISRPALARQREEGQEFKISYIVGWRLAWAPRLGLAPPFLPPTPTSRVRAIPGQETPWRRVGPNSSLAASRECRAPQPGPRPRQRLGQGFLMSVTCWLRLCSSPPLFEWSVSINWTP